jgi:hypothetical protein
LLKGKSTLLSFERPSSGGSFSIECGRRPARTLKTP